MKFTWMIVVAALTLLAGSSAGDAPQKIGYANMAKVADGVDNTFRGLWPEFQAEPIGVAQFIYIRGYGAVLTAKVNLSPGNSVTPFHPQITSVDKARTKKMKVDRMPALKTAMLDLLAMSAAQLRDVPDNEEIALGVTLFYWVWEDRTDLPDQVVMHATKKALLAAGQSKAALAAAVRMDVF
jgi:hypothetical protein